MPNNFVLHQPASRGSFHLGRRDRGGSLCENVRRTRSDCSSCSAEIVAHRIRGDQGNLRMKTRTANLRFRYRFCAPKSTNELFSPSASSFARGVCRQDCSLRVWQESFRSHKRDFISRSRARQRIVTLMAMERRDQELRNLERAQLFIGDVMRKPRGVSYPPHPIAGQCDFQNPKYHSSVRSQSLVADCLLVAVSKKTFKTNFGCFSERLYNPKKRVMSKREMRDLSEKLYRRLPEVTEAAVRKRRQDEQRTNRVRAQMFKQVQRTQWNQNRKVVEGNQLNLVQAANGTG